MFKSALFHAQFLAFFAGFFFCAGVSNGIRHPSSMLWLDFSILAIVFLLWSKRHAEKLKRKLPQISDVYAEKHGFEIIRTYKDIGRSGVVAHHRPGLLQLLNDVVNYRARYKVILVYDVSRWGRFQDVDESAHYEFLCKRAGVTIHYCAEQFENDGRISDAILKTLKRTMAGEYSRELGVKNLRWAKGNHSQRISSGWSCSLRLAEAGRISGRKTAKNLKTGRTKGRTDGPDCDDPWYTARNLLHPHNLHEDSSRRKDAKADCGLFECVWVQNLEGKTLGVSQCL